MAVPTEPRVLPYGIGQFSLRWIVVILALLALLGLGAYAYSRQVMEGEVVTGMRDVGTMGGAPWGLYIAFELYSVGLGFGAMLLLGLIGIMRLSHLQPLSRTLGLITLTMLVVGYLSVIADVGQPLRAIVNIARYARPMSPFFGTFTIGLVTSLIATWVYLYLDSRRDAALLASRPTGWRGFLRVIAAGYKQTPQEEVRHRYVSLVLAVILVVLGIAAASTSGFVFSVQVARAGWYSALQAPIFVLLGLASATGSLIVVAAVLRKVLAERERLSMRVFKWLNNIMTAATFGYIYFLFVELVTTRYAGYQYETRVTDATIRGEFAWLFWLSAGLFVTSFLIGAFQAVWQRYSLPLMIAAALIVNVAVALKRYLLVVPSLVYGSLLPYPTGQYSPTWVEFAVVLGLLALGGLLCILFMKVFPILDVRGGVNEG